MLSSGIVGSYCDSMDSHLRNCYVVPFYIPTNGIWSSDLYTSLPASVLFVFFIIVILLRIKWYLIMILICIFLTILNVFSGTSWPFVYLLEKMCIQILVHFNNCYLSFITIMNCLYIINFVLCGLLKMKTLMYVCIINLAINKTWNQSNIIFGQSNIGMGLVIEARFDGVKSNIA